MGLKFLFALLTCTLGIQIALADYPQVADSAGDLSLFDQTLNYRKNTKLFDVREAEISALLSSAQSKADKASDLEISRAGISPSGLRGVSARELYKGKVFEDLVRERNLELIKKMNSLPIPQSKDPSKVTTLTYEQIKTTAASIENSPATDSRPSLKDKYDPDRSWGYCFLRAHYYAGSVAQRGLDMSSVRKVFLVGTMKLLGAGWAPIKGWQYHVATAVRGQDGKWYVLDNHLGKEKGKGAYAAKVYTVEEWYSYYEKFLGTKEELKFDNAQTGESQSTNAHGLFLYFTDADRVSAVGDAYTKGNYYGVDRNKNGRLERREMYFDGAFVDVDDYLSLPISRCSNEHYKPLPADSKECQNMTAAERAKILARQNLVEKWRLDSSFEAEQQILPSYDSRGAR